MTTETKPEKYFLCFGFDNFSPDDLEKFHVTLVYFGVMGNVALIDMINVVEVFLYQRIYTRYQQLTFNHVAMFGRDKNIRVLLPAPELKNNHVFHKQFQVLRDRTEKFMEKEDFPFNPHLTTDLKYFSGNIDKLYLCGRGYRVIKSWTL